MTVENSVFKKLKHLFSVLPGVEVCENQVGPNKTVPDREKEEEILHCLQEEQYTQNEVSFFTPIYQDLKFYRFFEKKIFQDKNLIA